MDVTLTTPQGSFVLRRHHDHGDAPLRAWDAADEYALTHVAEHGPEGGARVLVVNDGFGALAVALATRHQVVSWSDSAVAHAATRANAERNGVADDAMSFEPSTAIPTGRFDVVVVKVPRTLSFLAAQVRALTSVVDDDTLIVGAGMTKLVHTSTIEAFERHLGPTPTTRARKKARLLLPEGPVASPPDVSLPDTVWTTDDGIEVHNLPNTFSRQGLDHGTRLLLRSLPTLPAGSIAVDLGCGNGVVGAALAANCPDVQVVCCDESHHAVESARRTMAPFASRASFHTTDVLAGIDGPVDLVVVNPPFHTGGARTTSVAEEMFAQSARVLRPEGELRVVANRHLTYHATLKRHFGSVEVAASDPKFVVLRARDPRRS